MLVKTRAYRQAMKICFLSAVLCLSFSARGFADDCGSIPEFTPRIEKDLSKVFHDFIRDGSTTKTGAAVLTQITTVFKYVGDSDPNLSVGQNIPIDPMNWEELRVVCNRTIGSATVIAFDFVGKDQTDSEGNPTDLPYLTCTDVYQKGPHSYFLVTRVCRERAE